MSSLRLVRCFTCRQQFADKSGLRLGCSTDGKKHLYCSKCLPVVEQVEQLIPVEILELENEEYIPSEISDVSRPDGYTIVEESQQYTTRDYVNGETFHVYGSPLRPMSASWARIPDAVFVNADKTRTGVHTWAVVPHELDATTISRYELEHRYGPIVWQLENVQVDNKQIARNVLTTLLGNDTNLDFLDAEEDLHPTHGVLPEWCYQDERPLSQQPMQQQTEQDEQEEQVNPLHALIDTHITRYQRYIERAEENIRESYSHGQTNVDSQRTVIERNQAKINALETLKDELD